MKELTIRLVRIPEPGDGSSPLRKPRKRSEKPKKKLPNVVWTKEVTKEKIKQATNKNECLECGLKLGEGKTGAKRVAMHIKQHFTKMYCCCGFHSQSRDSVYHHQMTSTAEGHQGEELRIHEVDAGSYVDFARTMGLPAKLEFPPCIPTFLPNDKLKLIKHRLPILKPVGINQQGLQRRQVTFNRIRDSSPEEGEIREDPLMSQGTKILSQNLPLQIQPRQRMTGK